MGARKRTLDPGTWSDEGFLELSDGAKLLFIGLISTADDEGRGSAMPRSLKARIFPGDEGKNSEKILRMLAECSANTHLMIYELSGGLYFQLIKWKDYQKVDHPQPSTIPGPTPEALKSYFAERSPNVQESFALINQLINKVINYAGGKVPDGGQPGDKSDDGMPVVTLGHARTTGRARLEADLKSRRGA